MALNDSAATPARKLLEHALLLIARQHGGNAATAAAARDELARWRSAAPAHEAAAEAALRGWAATEASSLQGMVAAPPTQAERDARTRRRVLSALGIAGMAIAVGGGTRWYWLQPLERLALQTGQGQLLARTLQDGSHLDLAPHTRAQATLYRSRREVLLAQGEIRFDVQHDADRPFDVLTEWGRVRVLGTAFTVAVRGERMTVAVAQGRVAVWPGPSGAQEPVGRPGAELEPGQAVHVGASGMGPVDTVRPGDIGAWRQGWLVFDRAPLADVVARWNDYLAQPLTLADEPALRDLRLTGSFPVRDPGAFIFNLPKVLPVRVETSAGGLHTIRLR